MFLATYTSTSCFLISPLFLRRKKHFPGNKFIGEMAHVMEKVRLCESIIGYEFIQKRHCVDALFAYSGYCHELGPVVLIKKNDGLAVLGDIVLQLRLCKKWLDLGLSRGKLYIIHCLRAR